MIDSTTEEQSILCAQHLDLIYSQSGTLYDNIPNAPCPSNYLRRHNSRPHVDGVVGFVSHAYVNHLAEQMGYMSITSYS
jgi:hypothetical protein